MLLGMNLVHHSLALSSVPSSPVDSFNDFGMFIYPRVFQSCIRELGSKLQWTQVKTGHRNLLDMFKNSAQVWTQDRDVYKKNKIFTALLFPLSPSHSQCQFTPAHSYPDSFYSIHDIAVEVAPIQFNDFVLDPSFSLFTVTSWSVLKEDLGCLWQLVEWKDHTMRRHNGHISWGKLRCCSHKNHQTRPQSTT